MLFGTRSCVANLNEFHPIPRSKNAQLSPVANGAAPRGSTWFRIWSRSVATLVWFALRYEIYLRTFGRCNSIIDSGESPRALCEASPLRVNDAVTQYWGTNQNMTDSGD